MVTPGELVLLGLRRRPLVRSLRRVPFALIFFAFPALSQTSTFQAPTFQEFDLRCYSTFNYVIPIWFDKILSGSVSNQGLDIPRFGLKSIKDILQVTIDPDRPELRREWSLSPSQVIFGGNGRNDLILWRGNGSEANKTFAFNGKEKILTVHTKVEKSELLDVLLCR